jgi:hypothetical protein
LLIEESRTNLALRSEDFGNATWVKSNATISGTLYTAPTGASTANELIEDTLLANHICLQNAATATIGTTYTFSVFVKRKDTSNQFILIGASGLVSPSFISVNLTNGVTATGIGSPGSPVNVSSTAYPNGWYRVQFSVVATSAAAATLDIRLSRDGTWANRSYLGDGVQSSLLWGAQLEAGSFATSYIPTTTAPMTRSADVCSITGGNFNRFYNSTSGTLLSEAVVANLIGSNRGIVQIDNGTNESVLRHVYGFPDGGFRSIIRASGDTSTELSTVLGTASTIQKRIIAYEGTGFASVTNGGAVATATRTMPTGLNAMKIGNLAESSFYLSGHIAAIRFYKKRLPNAKLVTLTT